MTEQQLRKDIIRTALAMNSLGINRGTSGNVSARWKTGFLITPSGRRYENTRPADIVFVNAAGKPSGKWAPSSEWRFHHDIYHNRSDVGAVVHTHSSFATTIACLCKDVPAFHYMIAVAGGNNIRCAPYATFGTQKLSNNALKALADRKACLLANHGMIATGAELEKALSLAIEVEALCEQYWRALQIGKPKILSVREMNTVLRKFRSYGTPSRTSDK
ncbi:MAG: class II aldolase/adducin family protein [Betaproteobacteria bacterium]|nr:MAG: class II aldolase/adducin family protein [Betaproteobacteria bacterium]